MEYPLNQDKLLTLKEVSERLRLSISTIKRYLKVGKLIGVQYTPTSHWRVLESSCNDYILKGISKKI